MDIETLRIYCLSKKGSNEEFPFDEVTLAFKVIGKIFAILPLDGVHPTFNLKCDPEWAESLRDENEAIKPGFHMNKKHWNTIYLNGNVEDRLIFAMVDHSYQLVVDKLSKVERKTLETMPSIGNPSQI